MYWLWCIDFNYTGSVVFVACANHYPMAACLSAWKYSTLGIARSQSASPVDGSIE